MNSIYWFFLFLLVPVFVHLFNFRRAKKIFFTNVRFIKGAISKTKAKTRLKHLLILACRMVIFLLLILTFSSFLRVYLDDDNGGSPVHNHYYYLDNSLSFFHHAPSKIIDKVGQIIHHSRAEKGYLITNDFAPFSNMERSAQELIAELPNIRDSYVSRSLSEVLGRMDKEKKSIYIFSDFKQVTRNELEAIKRDTINKYRLYLESNGSINNVFVDTVSISRDIDDYNYLKLLCKLSGTSDALQGSYVVKLLDTQQRQLSSVISNRDNNYQVEFSVPVREQGEGYVVKISGDEVLYDNEFHFVVEAKKIPSILLLTHEKESYFSKVFGNQTLFNLVEMNPVHFEYENIQNADIVILEGHFQIPRSLIEQSSSNTSFLIVPHDTIDAENYETEIGIPLKPNVNKEWSELQIQPLYLKGIFEGNMAEVMLPKSRSLYAFHGSTIKILSQRTGEGFLVKDPTRPLYITSSPINDKYSTLPVHSLFLPLMYRLAESSIGDANNGYLYPGNYLEIPTTILDVPPKLTSNYIDIIPEFANLTASAFIKIPTHIPPGFYHVILEKDTVKSIGVNLPKKESQANTYTPTQLENFFMGTDHVQMMTLDESDEDMPNSKTNDGRLWKFTLILTLIFLMIETALHKYVK